MRLSKSLFGVSMIAAMATTCPLSDPSLSVFAANLPFILFLVIFFAVYPLMMRGRKKALEALAAKYNGTVRFSLFAPTLDGSFGGLKFRIRLIPQGKNTPPYLDVTFFKSFFYKLNISREDFWTRFAARMGWMQDVAVHDPLFDKEFAVSSDKPGRAVQYLSNDNVKNAVRDVFAAGFVSLRCDGKKMFLRKPNYRFPQDLEADAVDGLLQKLSLLANAL